MNLRVLCLVILICFAKSGMATLLFSLEDYTYGLGEYDESESFSLSATDN